MAGRPFACRPTVRRRGMSRGKSRRTSPFFFLPRGAAAGVFSLRTEPIEAVWEGGEWCILVQYDKNLLFSAKIMKEFEKY